MLLCSNSFSYFIKGSLKSYGATFFYDDRFLTIVGSAAFLVSAVAKFGWGTIQDYLGFFKVYWTIIIVQSLVCLTLNHIARYTVAYFIWILLIFACEGGHFVLFPALASDIYGSR